MDIKLKFKYTRKANQAEPIHHDLIKMEVSYDLKRIFCLMDRIIWVLDFDSPVLIESKISCTYINDFSIYNNLMVIGSGTQSRNEALKLLDIGSYCHYNWNGEPERGNIVWATKTRFGINKRQYSTQPIDEFNESKFSYIKFIPAKNQFVALGCFGTLYKVSLNGKVISKFNIDDRCFLYQHHCRNRVIDINDEYIFALGYKTLSIYDIDTFSLKKQIEFDECMHIIKALKKMDFIIISENGTLYSSEKNELKQIAKISKEIVAFEYDETNSIFYFGNSSGEIFAINRNAELILDEILGDSIRDILVLNNGNHILFGGKNINFFVFENKNENERNDKLNFRKGKGNGMKKIFLSYSHKNFELADFIDTELLNNGIQLIRDVRDIRYRQSIKEFMKGIRKTDFVFIIISRDYLLSSMCMYEVLELIKDENYRDRIIPIICSDADIFNINGKADYIKYWQDEFKKCEINSQGIDMLNRTFYINELKKIESIQRNLSEFLELISDMNLITCKNSTLTDNEIRTIIEIINS